ncbi:MAG: DHA2 family efflux MFS transporter permease subunit [Actinobacteria bacterium]|nr:DHA2 family efflux MFS transporter permease subunit [Actinomycetota bacterium]MBO0785511.1 DHA2 family efflux MFS transporter permease subunit [Actinomycetota bacterium]
MTDSSTGQQPTADGGREAGLSREVLLLSAVVILGTIMTVLDLTIVNVAIPTLGTDLNTSIAAIQWVLTGYMLAFATVIPVTGWAAERFGAKRVWLAALLVFLAGSALAGASWSIGSLIAFRVLQGLGAGMILPVGQAILAQAAGPARMGRVMSVVGVPMLLAPVFGPLLGGAIIGAASWRWIFFLNLPVGAAALLAAWRLLPAAAPRAGQRLDVRGLLLLSPGIAVFLYGMSEAGSHGGFGRPVTITAALAGLALIALFGWHASRRGAGALIDISLLRRRGFATAAAVNLLLMIGLFGSLILIPLYYQVVRHDTALQIGLLLAPQGIGAALALPLAGWLTDKAGARGIATAGIAVAALGTLAYTQLGARTPGLYLSAALLVIGMGIGATVTPTMAAAFAALSRAETPRGTSALNAIQRIAGAIGTALFAIILQRAITGSMAGRPGGATAIASLSRQQQAHAATELAGAFGTTFWVAVALLAAALVPALLLPRPRREQPGPGPGAQDPITQGTSHGS